MATAEVLREGLELALRSGTIANGGWIAGSLGDAAQLLGRLEESEEHQRLAVDLARRVGDEPLIGQRLITLATVVLMRGRIDEAVAYRDEADPSWRRTRSRRGRVRAAVRRVPGPRAGRSSCRGGSVRRGRRARPRTQRGQLPRVHRGMPARVRAPRRSRDRAETYRDLESSHRFDPERGPRHGTSRGCSNPIPPRRSTILREAVARFDRLEMRVFAARAMVDLGRAMTRAGEDPRELLERARAILIECDARLFLFEVDEALAGLAP